MLCWTISQRGRRFAMYLTMAFWQVVTRHFQFMVPTFWKVTPEKIGVLLANLGDSSLGPFFFFKLGAIDARSSWSYLFVTLVTQLLDVVLRRALILRPSCIGCFAPPKKGGWKYWGFFLLRNPDCPTAFGKPWYFSMGFYSDSNRKWAIFWLSSCAHAKEINWKRILGKDGFQFVVLKCLDSRHWHSMIPDLNIVQCWS